jgi:hypothetical protein
MSLRAYASDAGKITRLGFRILLLPGRISEVFKLLTYPLA